ncbi:hypothetical protein L198_05684 [Cryptococcus wingfieldii CBS 7118]|uniref:PIPK domain-containing protein n=1 Tax=Cryptococcus wingfieldii CBS 7118 TaxID=1295528 RepID=A0A1E3ITX1_9TREE|nr:hypothetical protein L198_05684 [Cryptococcus wingfieldii CBS 7118]ODN92012.1 hypothetical protein L198_05684 [Cryptococcus wingfieldii CBS 7118]
MSHSAPHSRPVSPHRHTPSLPLPPRSTSPPLSPRRNLYGLPPTYLQHLRALLHQWLAQQELEGGPEGKKLWSEERLARVESAIWEGAVLTAPAKDSRRERGVLEQDWNGWVKGSTKRIHAWKGEMEEEGRQLLAEKRAKEAQADKEGKGKGKTSRKASSSENDRGRLAIPEPFMPASASTPSKQSTRASSIASLEGSSPLDTTLLSRLERHAARREAEEDQEAQDLEDWCRVVRSLKGFVKFTTPKREDWETVNADLIPKGTVHGIPGAFPQSGHEYRHSIDVPSSVRSHQSPFFDLGLPITSTTQSDPAVEEFDMLKPVFCLHIPFESAERRRSEASTSQTTLRLRRDHSISGRSTTSMGSTRGKGWFSGSGSKWSDLLGDKSHFYDEDDWGNIEVDFVEGKFALPSQTLGSPYNSVKRRRSSLPSSVSRRQSVFSALEAVPTSFSSTSSSLAIHSQASTSKTDSESDSDEASSVQSSTQQGHEFVGMPYNAIISGEENDMPKEAVIRGNIGLVGGTIVIRGIRRDEEKKALVKVLKALVYTIATMTLELDLLDSFRIPREQDEPPVLPKPPTPLSNTPSEGDLSRGVSPHVPWTERQSKRGFLSKLTRDTKGVWKGLLGRTNSTKSRDHSRQHPSPLIHQMDLPSSPSLLPSPTSTETPLEPQDDTPSPSNLPPYLMNGPITNSNSHHLQTLGLLREILPSTTPGLKYPMPSILLRLFDEDQTRRAKAQVEIDGENDSANASTSTLFPGPHPMARDGPDPIRGRALAYRLGGDVRSGLNSLASGLETFDGWIRLQRLSTLYCVGLNYLPNTDDREEPSGSVICQPPKLQTLSDDVTITDYLMGLYDELAEENLLCPRVGCEAENSEHVRWFIHGGTKVGVQIVECHAGPETQAQGDDIETWSKCDMCGSESSPRRLSDGARAYPWIKVLEFLIYTTGLQSSICPHSSIPFVQAHYLRTPGLAISLATSEVSLLDMRLPKLQVGPNVPKRKSTKDNLLRTPENLNSSEQDCDNALRGSEVVSFFDALDSRVALLRGRLEAGYEAGEELRPERTTPDLQKKLASLAEVSTTSSEARQQTMLTLAAAPAKPIDEARQFFTERIRVSLGALEEWQKTYLTQDGQEDGLVALKSYLPDHKKKASKDYALPGSGVLVKEDQPASVVAYTLSSLAYFTELTASSKSTDEASTPETAASVSAPESKSSSMAEWSIKVERRDSPRDLLSLRSIVKKPSDASLSLDKSKFAPPAVSISNAAPSTEVFTEAVEGVSQSADRMEEIVRAIEKATGNDPILSNSINGLVPSRRASVSESDTSSLYKSRASPRGPKSSDAPPSSFRGSRNLSTSSVPRLLSPQTPVSTLSSKTGTAAARTMPPNTRASSAGWGSSMTSSFANSIWRFGSEVGDTLSSIRTRHPDRSLQSLIAGPLGGMDTSLSNLDPRPHLYFEYTLPDKLRLSCTVYFATAFDSLRRRCAVDKALVESLEETEEWNADGGKSKAGFWMSKDKKFIVKELVSKWTVSDMHALLEISPAYFNFMTSTHNRATSLAKIVGFYTVTIKDLHSGTKRQLDLLVMENLFYSQSISQTFDLKGIEGRKVVKRKTEGEVESVEVKGPGTLFDADWLENMQNDLVLLQPHAKKILLDAIALDTKFLASQSIMDYSLLLGIDDSSRAFSTSATAAAGQPAAYEEQVEAMRRAKDKTLIVGLVDAIGSFNLFKTIESRGKMALNRGGDVTVIPPDQYRERFESAMRHYFIACPDKWSRVSSSPRGAKRGRAQRERMELGSIL